MTEQIQILQAPSRLDAVYAPTLRNDVALAAQAGVTVLIVDFTDTVFIDSSGMAALVSGHKAMRQKNGRFVLANVHGGAREIFDLTRMDLVFTMTPSVEAARRTYGDGV
ncbi:MAG: STAS domain-containing protein [Anaerolineae bacterium]|nr:STAS domain-containing protein [Anaerolineae bacterium]